jgi:hypothetical protein
MLGDVQAMEHQLAVVLLDERVDQRRVAGAHGFHLVADQDDPGLVCLEDRVVVPGPPVRGDKPSACFPGRGALLLIQSIRPTAQGTLRPGWHTKRTGRAARANSCSVGLGQEMTAGTGSMREVWPLPQTACRQAAPGLASGGR